MTSPADKSAASNAPPTMITAAQRHELARQFERAKRLMAATPPDFRGVHRVLSECLSIDPGNTLFLAALLENLELAGGKTASAWPWQIWRQQAELTKAIQEKNWRQALVSGWWLLGERPRDAAVLVQLARVCGELDHLPTQIQLLRAANERRPADPAVLDALARALAAAGRFQESAAVWREWIGHFESSEDPEPRQFLDALGETVDPEEDDVAATDPKGAPLSERVKRLMAAHRWDAAEQLLAAESSAAGALLELRTLGEEIMLGRARDRTAIAERLFHFSVIPAHRRLIDELLEEQRRIELGVAFARYERFPSEPAASYELANCLTRAGNYSEALKYLSKLVDQENWRFRALLATAENWQHLRQFERALEAYRQALKMPHLDPRDELTQKGWYRGAILAEAMGDPSTAATWLTLLTTAKPGYKDCGARLDNLRTICNKG